MVAVGALWRPSGRGPIRLLLWAGEDFLTFLDHASSPESFGVLFALTHFIFDGTLPNLKSLCFCIVRDLSSVQVFRGGYCLFLLSGLVLPEAVPSTVMTLRNPSLQNTAQ